MKGFLSACSAISAVIVVICLPACGSKPPESSGGCTRLAADRAAKDEMFQKGADPVPENRKAALLPLAYFPAIRLHGVPAGLKPSQDDTVIQTRRPPAPCGRCVVPARSSSRSRPAVELTAPVDPSDRNLDHPSSCSAT